MSALIDFEQGLRHCDQHPRIYRAVLQEFLAQYQQGIDSDVLLQSPEQAKLALHTLKGLCATIGARELSQQAAATYRDWPTLSGEDAQVQLQQLNRELSDVIQAIHSYLM